MLSIIKLTACLSLLLGSTAMAGEAHSLGFVIAKRVAATENTREPSRALWLSTRVVTNARSLAAVTPVKADKNQKNRAVKN